MGKTEAEKAFSNEAQTLFDETLEQIQDLGTGAKAGKYKFRALRSKYDKPYTDESGILDALIDRVEEKSLSIEEAHFYFGLLQTGKLMEYRRETGRPQADLHQKEVLTLLNQALEARESDSTDIAGLLRILNNYYEFTSLEYDEEYFKLSNLIHSLEREEISSGGLSESLTALRKKVIQNINLREANIHQNLAEEATNSQTNSSEGNRNASNSAASPTAGGSGQNSSGNTSQKPGGGSPGSRSQD